MILINKYELLKEVAKRKYSAASMRLINEQPEVKAIPIEWIRKQIEKALSVDSVDLFYVGNLKHLIKEWERENETN